MKHDYEGAIEAVGQLQKYNQIGNYDAAEDKADELVSPYTYVIIHALKLAQRLEKPASDEMLDGKAREELLNYSLSRDITKASALDMIWIAMVEQMKKETE